MPSKLRQSDGTFITAEALSNETVQINSATIPTSAGATDTYVTAPVTGSLTLAQVTSLTALATSDTNYITFTVTNITNSNAVMLATTPAGVNTTKATGGAALAVNTVHPLTPSATATAVLVTKGDRLKITATGAGTLAGTVTVPTYMLTFNRTS